MFPRNSVMERNMFRADRIVALYLLSDYIVASKKVLFLYSGVHVQ